MDVKKYLTSIIDNMGEFENKNKVLVPDVTLDPDKIRMIMISEVTPPNSDDYFYSRKPDGAFITSVLGLFKASGVDFETIDDIVNYGIYITTAVKTPKNNYTITTDTIREQLPILEAELDMFPNLKVIMLMGDVAKKAVNTIVRKRTKKGVIPSESTYKIRHQEFFYNGMRVFPSYIMTGENILIEKSKVGMITEDIRNALTII
jgi:uracil-DNA glycosylase